MSDSSIWIPFWISLKLAVCTTFILLIVAVPLCHLIHDYKFRVKTVMKAFITLPLVLPPTALGYYILVIINKEGTLGKLWFMFFNDDLAFSFSGILIGSVVYSLPFMVNPIYSGLESLPSVLKESSYMLGKNRFYTYWRILLPNVKPSIFTAIAMTFAHTIGEFGVIVMIGGSISGETKVASIALYEALEILDFELANAYAILMLVFALMILFLVYKLKNKIGL